MRSICVVECKTKEGLIELSSTPQTKEEAEAIALIYVLSPEQEPDKVLNQLPGLYSEEDISAFREEATGLTNDNRAMLMLFWNYMVEEAVGRYSERTPQEIEAELLVFMNQQNLNHDS